MIRVPEYVDGYFELYQIVEDTSKDYPVETLKDMRMQIWFREISVFDRIRYEFEQGGKEITMKIRIPRFNGIDSKCACKIDEKIHIVYNAASVTSKEGFKETELTLIRPGKDLKING